MVARRRQVERGFAHQARRTMNAYAFSWGRAYHVLAAAPDDATLDEVYRHYVVEDRRPMSRCRARGSSPARASAC